jgi:RNA polymerase sigma factor (sigma-70 family)
MFLLYKTGNIFVRKTMINMEEAQQLMEKFIELRGKMRESKSITDQVNFEKHEALCIQKFIYLVTMKTGRYKAFSNYEDLNQEGMLALVKSMINYNPKKGCFFYWAHRYIDTRISRSANLHTTIRYPLKVAKAVTPHKESILPLLIEERYCPDKELESSQTIHAVEAAMNVLSLEQQNIINLAYGFDGDKPLSINKICKKLGVSRLNCIKLINGSLAILKDKIKL